MIEFDGRIELLAARHDRRNFSCGEPALDDYLRRLARQHAASGNSGTYVGAELGQLVQSAAAGEVIVLTRRGKPIAEIRAPQADIGQENAARAIRLRESQSSVFELPALAGRHRLTSYDALYLEAALASGLPLATRDKALRQAAIDSGVGVWQG